MSDSAYLCGEKKKNINYIIMATIQLREELFREMNPMLERCYVKANVILRSYSFC